MKYLAALVLSLILATSLTLFSSVVILAATNPPATDHNSGLTQIQTSKSATRSADQIATLKQAAANLIAARIDAINKLIDRINAASQLTSAEKSSLVTDLKANVTGLQGLGTQINGDTVLATLKTDVKSIFETYRIFMVELPKTEGTTLADKLEVSLNRMQTVSTKINTLIQKVAANGTNTTSMNSLFLDYQKQIADAKTQIATARTDFQGMKPSDPTGSQTLFNAGKVALKTARTDLTTARSDLQSIITQLKASLTEKKATGSATPSGKTSSSSGSH